MKLIYLIILLCLAGLNVDFNNNEKNYKQKIQIIEDEIVRKEAHNEDCQDLYKRLVELKKLKSKMFTMRIAMLPIVIFLLVRIST
jgi:hypothetical protein